MRMVRLVAGLSLAAAMPVAACGGGGSGRSGETGPDAGSLDAASDSTSAAAPEAGGGNAAEAGANGPEASANSPDTGTAGGDAGIVATAVCGTAMLQGPTTAPAGAVVVSPGPSTIQDALAAQTAPPSGGTTYYLTAGTYFLSGPINPRDNDTFVGAPGAILDGSNTQPVAFGLNDHASGVTIRYLTIQHFAGPQNNGIVNQGQGAGWTIQYNTIQDNPDTNGGADGILLGDGNVVSYNCLKSNGQTGIASVGTTGFVVDHNEVSLNAQGYEAAHPCGCSGGMKFFTSTSGVVTNNWIHDNGNVGVWVDTNNSFFLIQGNVIEKNFAEAVMYEISYNAVIDGNLIRFNGIGGNAQASAFPEPSIYVSESGGFDAGSAVVLSGVDVNGVLRIADNTFYDNADGVVLYQNATRCCGATDGCSASCSPAPLYSEFDGDGNQRWKTQNVTVSNNTFAYDADAGCTTDAAQNNYCGVTGLFSTETAVDDDIAFHQNNRFEDNTYSGPWQFLTPDQGSTLLPPAAWQASPYNQDPGSTFH